VPELPEAETIGRTLAAHAEGRRIESVEWLSTRVHRGRPPQLAGRTVRRVHRFGKAVLFDLDRGCLLVHLGMTGKLLWRGERGPYTRAVVILDRGEILFDDVRQFGSIRWCERPPAGLGPDPLEIGAHAFVERVQRHKGRIKPLLLNQGFLRGVGNIYADEILFRAMIHPLAPASRLSERRLRRLHKSMTELLEEAIAQGGSSISDYVDATGREGSFQLRHQVYGREGQPCPRCGASICRILVAQRGTHYCPRCQRT